ncbi:hypothetical protein M0811_09916 [Anaeramoeba ignava]|uniref:Uncharacterized protein n=1 Tax=Anaeramoeba ignava TaxID=1746090 RepID=A0A9Q0R9D6_ANAIG|nr:hypothetical protein M0811_09916 [Anaeramoeba ignava]
MKDKIETEIKIRIFLAILITEQEQVTRAESMKAVQETIKTTEERFILDQQQLQSIPVLDVKKDLPSLRNPPPNHKTPINSLEKCEAFIHNGFLLFHPQNSSSLIRNFISDKKQFNNPSIHVNTFYALKTQSKTDLSDGALRMKNTPNAGGTSVISEYMSFEVLKLAFDAKLLSTETEIRYYPEGKITDYVASINKVNIGVSVTRAMKFPIDRDFDENDAKRLLEKKLYGVICSTRNAQFPKFKRQILHIWSVNKKATDVLLSVYNNNISNDLKSNTIVIITTADGKKAQSIFWEVSNTN